MMSKKISLFLPVLLVLFAGVLTADEKDDQIKAQNRKVTAIDKILEEGSCSFMTVGNTLGTLEFRPPELRFYYDRENFNLIAVTVAAGHETWSKFFTYYYDQGENIIKYLEVIDRMDNPPRLAIIYDREGDVLWSNTEEPASDPSALRDFYHRTLQYQIDFSSY